MFMFMFILYHITVICVLILVGYLQLPEPVLPPDRMAQIDLSCADGPPSYQSDDVTDVLRNLDHCLVADSL